MALGLKIRAYMHASGIDEPELARQLGCSRANLLRWIAGRNSPRATVVLKLLSLLPDLEAEDFARPTGPASAGATREEIADAVLAELRERPYACEAIIRGTARRLGLRRDVLRHLFAALPAAQG
jgi:transcriptional regulator with XRE-family HTH domain